MAARKSVSKQETVRPEGPVRVVLLIGADARRKQARVDALMGAADADFADFDTEVMDPDQASAERILSAVATVPFGNGRRVIVVRDTQRLDTEEQKRLAAGLGLVPGSGLLVLSTGYPVVEEGRVRKQSVVIAELSTAVRKVGDIEDFEAPKAEDLRPRLLEIARGAGKTLDSGALSMLLQLPSDDLRHAEIELEKALLHAGDADRVGIADVEAVLSRGPDEVIFKLCDAVGSRRGAEALGLLSSVFAAGARPEATALRTLVMLTRQIRLIMQFRYLGEQRMVGRQSLPVSDAVKGVLPSDGALSLLANPRSGWMVDKLVGQARRFTAPELETRMRTLLDADLRLKGLLPGGDNPLAVMQRLVVELCT